MAWNFRKSKKLGGVRGTVSKKSVSASVGGKWARATVNSKGQRTYTVGIPGTGLRWSTRSKKRKAEAPDEEEGESSGGSALAGCFIVLVALIGTPILLCGGIGFLASLSTPIEPPATTPATTPAIAPVVAPVVADVEPQPVEPPEEEIQPVEIAEQVIDEPDHRMRWWTDATGKFKTDAKLFSISGDKVTLKKRDGSVVTLPLDRLSVFDREYVEAVLNP